MRREKKQNMESAVLVAFCWTAGMKLSSAITKMTVRNNASFMFVDLEKAYNKVNRFGL